MRSTPFLVFCFGAVLMGCAPARPRLILFQALHPGDSEDIYTLDFRTSDVRRITHGDTTYANSFPAWSPRGDEIAFVRQSQHDSLFVLNTREGRLHPLNTPDVTVLGPPAWSPDGTEILISVGETVQHRQLYRVRVNGSGHTRVPLGTGMHDCGSYSPKGDQIVATQVAGEESAIVVFDLARATVDTLVASDSVYYHCPEWSPRGKSIGVSVYSKDYSRGAIAVLDVARHALRVIPAGPGYNNALKWSPDGAWLLYQCTEFSGSPEDPTFYRSMEVCAVHPDGRDRRRLTQNTHFDAHPSW